VSQQRFELGMKEIFVIEDTHAQTCTTPRELFALATRINIDHRQEPVIALFLDNRSQVIKSEVIFMGGIVKSLLDQRLLFQRAYAQNAVKIEVAHNHPNGCLSPSDANLIVFDRLK